MALQDFFRYITTKHIDNLEHDIVLAYVEVGQFSVRYEYPMGILSIATVLKNDGFKVKFVSSKMLVNLSYSEKKEFFKKANPKIFGLSLDSDNYDASIAFARRLRKTLPNTIFLVGGPLVNIIKDKALDSGAFDYAIAGEGEFSVRDFARHVIRGELSLDEVPGLIYLKDGKVISNPLPPPIKNLDDLPSIDYSMIDNSHVLNYISGRGCPFSCSFCCRTMPSGYRFFSSERVVSDIVKLAQRGASTIVIVDDTFIANIDRAKKICEGIESAKKQYNLDFNLFCEARADAVCRHPEIVSYLKKAGFTKMQLGIESGVQKILDLYNKKVTLEQIEKAVDIIYENRPMIITGNIILCAPFETEQVFLESLEFAKKLIRKAPGLLEINFPFLCPYPGTDIGEHPENYGLEIIDDKWYSGMTTQVPSCLPKGLTKEQAIERRLFAWNTVQREYADIVKNLPYDIIKFHMFSKIKGGETPLYSSIIRTMPIVDKYFYFIMQPGFMRLDEIPADELLFASPVRVMPSIVYGDSVNVYKMIDLPEEVIITDPLEMRLYNLCAGKINIGQIAENLKKDLPDKTVSEIIEHFMLPVFRKWESLYHLFFML